MERNAKRMTAIRRLVSLAAVLALLAGCIPMALAENTSLIIPGGSWGSWKKVSSKCLSFTFEVKNTDSDRTVRSYNVTYYTCDAYGAQNSPTETVTLNQKIKPYETVTSDIIYLSNPQDSCLAYVAVTGVTFTNGEKETVSTPNYSYWVLNEEKLMADPADITAGATTDSSYDSGSTADVHLIIPEDGSASLKRVSTKRYSIRFEVKNTNPSKTITSYQITYHTYDQYGSQNSGEYTTTLTQKIKPYETVTCPEIFLENAANVYEAIFGVSWVRYSDGSTESTSNPDYQGWYWE